MTELQLALDFLGLDEAMRLAGKVHAVCRRLECGTPLLLREGLRAVAELRRRCPENVIVADTKIADAGRAEAQMAFEAGADVVTVLATAGDETIAGAVAAAPPAGRVMGDLLAHPSPVHRARELQALGVHEVCVHMGVDSQAHGTSPGALLARVQAAVALPVAVGGGISLPALPAILALRPAVIVVGSAIVKAADPIATARQFQAALAAPASGAAPLIHGPSAPDLLAGLGRSLAGIADDAQERLIALLLGAERVFVAGQGRSGIIARAFAVRLTQLGLPTHVVGEATTPGIGPHDVLVACSGSGETASTLAQAARAKAAGAHVAGICGRGECTLARAADIAVTLSMAQGALKNVYSGTLFEQTLLVYLDAVALELMARLGLEDADLMARHANLE